MQILTTQRFVEQTREASGQIALGSRSLVQPTEALEEPRAVRLGGDKVFGYSLDQQGLKCWFMEDMSKVGEVDSPPLVSMSRAELRAMGIPRDLIGRLQALTRFDQLQKFDLPQDSVARLQMRFIQQVTGYRAREEDLIRKAQGVDHLLDFLNGNLMDLLLNLDRTQQRVVDLSPGGTIVVRGVAGSGKTSVLLHRIRRLLQEASPLEPKTILLVTYNRSLACAARELLDDCAGEQASTVEMSSSTVSVNTGSGEEASRHMPWALAYASTRATRSASREVNFR